MRMCKDVRYAMVTEATNKCLNDFFKNSRESNLLKHRFQDSGRLEADSDCKIRDHNEYTSFFLFEDPAINFY